jgi:hypothetical protein
MNRYTVVYLAEAEDNLISIWADATDRNRVAEAANEADRVLAEEPLSLAVYLGEELWRLDIDCVRFYFAIREQDRIVEVANVVYVEDKR